MTNEGQTDGKATQQEFLMELQRNKQTQINKNRQHQYGDWKNTANEYANQGLGDAVRTAILAVLKDSSETALVNYPCDNIDIKLARLGSICEKLREGEDATPLLKLAFEDTVEDLHNYLLMTLQLLHEA